MHFSLNLKWQTRKSLSGTQERIHDSTSLYRHIVIENIINYTEANHMLTQWQNLFKFTDINTIKEYYNLAIRE